MDKIFKAYDVRGIYPSELDEQKAKNIAKAFVLYLKDRYGTDKPKIVLGRDNRLSSDAISTAVIEGLTDQGAEVYDLGLVSTPMMYYACGLYETDGGMVITASHNPKDYNGIKFVGKGSIPMSIYSGLADIRDIAVKGEFEETEKGNVEKRDISEEYIKKNLEFLTTSKKFRIGVDTANAIGGDIAGKIFDNTDLEIDYYFKDLDGNFPNHEANPVILKNIEYLANKVVENKLDLGIAFDGDGDRIVFINELGGFIRADLILCLVTDILGVDKVAYEIRNTKAIRDLPVKGYMTKVGHAFLKEEMRKHDISFGGETSGHYFSKELYFSEAPFFVLFVILNYLAEKNITLSEAVKPYEKYYSSGDINVVTDREEQILEELEEKYKDADVCKIDGIRAEYKDWWFAVRASNTEPLLRLVIEADTEELLKEKIEELKEIVR